MTTDYGTFLTSFGLPTTFPWKLQTNLIGVEGIVKINRNSEHKFVG